MNITSGVYRLAQVIKWIGRVLGGIWIVVVYLNLSNSARTEVHKEEAIFFLCLAIIFVLITEGIAWILEGFASDKHQ
jgi:tetrahydromethanopterin S-methyltransferase subunit D